MLTAEQTYIRSKRNIACKLGIVLEQCLDLLIDNELSITIWQNLVIKIKIKQISFSCVKCYDHVIKVTDVVRYNVFRSIY